MNKIKLFTAFFITCAILLAVHSFYNEYSHLPMGLRWVKTVAYGLGPWLCASAFAIAKFCFQKLLSKKSNLYTTFQSVVGVIIGLMVFTKFLAN